MGVRSVIALLLIAFQATCASPPPDPAAIIGRAADDLVAAQTFRFVLTREGPPTLLDPVTGATFSQATGEYRSPDRVHARLKVVVGSFLVAVDALWLPEGVFVTDPVTGRYAAAPAGTTFDAAALFRRDGAAAILRGLRDVSLVGAETVDGTDAHHIRGSADGVNLRALSGGVLVEGTHTVDVWVDKGRSRVLRVNDREPGGGVWKLELSDFDKPVEIGRP